MLDPGIPFLCHEYKHSPSDCTKSPASRIDTEGKPSLMSQVREVVCAQISAFQCVSTVQAVEVSAFLRISSYLHISSQTESWMSPGPFRDTRWSVQTAANVWVKVDIWPLIHGGCCTWLRQEDRTVWDSRWRMPFKTTQSLRNDSRYSRHYKYNL